MKLFFTFFISLLAIKAMACKCAFSDEINSKNDLKRYDFIALVEIKNLAPLINPDDYSRKNGDIHFVTLELFKGQASSFGYNPFPSGDCALNINVGERWLFFGYKFKGKLQIGYCSASIKYSEINGVRDWWYFSGITQLNKLRALYGHPLPANVGNNVFYANGKIEIKQSISKTGLNGIRRIYYPSGRLYIIENFRHNKRIGYRSAYSPSGQLIRKVIYKNGLIGKITFYHDSAAVTNNIRYEARRSPYPEWHLEAKPVKKKLDSLLKGVAWLHISYQKTFEINGRGYKTYQYYPTGKIEHTETVNWKRKIATESQLLENGKLSTYYTYDKLKDKQIERFYDLGQTDVKKCINCDFYFGTTKPPAAIPEEVYIQ